MDRYVIIGAGNAGLSCAKTIRKYNTAADITVISHENFYPYCRCLLTYFIEGKVDKTVLFSKNIETLKKNQINYIKDEKVEYIETAKNRIKLSNGKKIYYDKLFIGAGAQPKDEYFSSDDSIIVTSLRTLNDAIKIKNNFKKGDTAIICGGGLVSLKTLLALYEKGVKIFWVVKSKYILSYLIDSESAEIIEDIIKNKAINLIKNADVVDVKNKIVKLDNGMEIKADGIILGKGVKAVNLNSDVKIKFSDGYIVNEYFETNVENIYAGGDCASVYDIAHNKSWKIALWPIAGEAGIYAGKNMCGIKSKCKGMVPVNSFSVFENNIVAGGKKKIEENEKKDFSEFSERKKNIFKKFITDKKGNLKGYVFINDIFKAGIYYYFVKGGAI